MGKEIVRLSQQDAPEALDFLNLVFSMAKYPHDFRKMLPKMWEDDGKHVDNHLAVKVDGRIRAIVGVYPLPANIAGEKLLFATMGNVATHPFDTGKGYMSELLDAAMKQLSDMNADGARLGGMRQRYARYGYEPCGTQYRFALTENNVSRYYSGKFRSDIVFSALDIADVDMLNWAKQLYEKNPVWIDRISVRGFYDSVTAWESKPYVAMQNGNPIGYLTITKDGAGINEVNADSADHIIEIVCAWLRYKKMDSVSFTAEPWQCELLRKLQPLCENWSINMPSRFYIRRWDRVVYAFMKLRQQVAPIADGRKLIGIQNYGTIAIEVVGGKVSVERTEETPDIVLGANEAARFFFGPALPYSACSFATPDSVLTSWLPLPLGWNTLDRV